MSGFVNIIKLSYTVNISKFQFYQESGELRSIMTATCIGPLTSKQKNIYLNKAPPDVSSHLAFVDMNLIMTF